jgi:hypothetical protein
VISRVVPGGVPDRLPLRARVLDSSSEICGLHNAHHFEVHVESGHLAHDNDARAPVPYVFLSARQAGIARLESAGFGVWVVAVAAYGKREDARLVVERWADQIAAWVTRIWEGTRA